MWDLSLSSRVLISLGGRSDVRMICFFSSNRALTELLGADGQLAYLVSQNGPVAAVTCELKVDENTESGYYFSTQGGSAVTLMGGEQATVQIVMDESAPISKVFPMFGGN